VGVLSLSSHQVTLMGGVLGLVLLAVFWDFWKAQFYFAVTFPSDWGHTLLIPAITAWMIWLKRDDLKEAQPFRPSWFGLPLITFGLAFYLMALVGPSWFALHHNARALGVAFTIFGLALMLLGWRTLTIIWFPLLYLVVFFQTYTERILRATTESLQDISAYGGFAMIRIFGIEAELSGNIITIYTTPTTPQALNIAEACSGMRMLVAFLALGVALAWSGLDSWWQRILMILIAVPVAVFVNMLRVASLGVLSLWDMQFTTGEFHQFVGFVWLIPAFVFYLGIMWVIRRLVIEEGSSGPSTSGSGASA
jgi:exosortase